MSRQRELSPRPTAAEAVITAARQVYADEACISDKVEELVRKHPPAQQRKTNSNAGRAVGCSF